MILHSHSDRKAVGRDRTPKNWCSLCRFWYEPATESDRMPVDGKLLQANDFVAETQQKGAEL